MKLASKMPIIGTNQLKQQVKLLNGINQKADNLTDIMNFFINGDWHFENKKIFDVIDKLSDEEKELFSCDVRQIDWHQYIVNYIKGLSIWAL